MLQTLRPAGAETGDSTRREEPVPVFLARTPAPVLVAQDQPAADVVIGLVTLQDDPRYVQDWGYARLIAPPPVRSIDGARMAIEDLAFVSEAMGLAPRMETREVEGGDAPELTFRRFVCAR